MRPACLLLVLASVLGCASAEEQPAARAAERRASPLRAQLDFFVEGEATRIEDFSADVIARADDARVRRSAQLWKMVVIPELRSSLLRADDQAALLHLWARNVQLQRYFAEGRGPQVFGAHAADGKALFEELTARAAELARVELGDARYASAAELVERYTQGHPLEADPLQAATRDSQFDQLLRDSLNKPLEVVMQPLRAINPGTGLSDTARAVHEFGATVEDVRRDLARLPEQIRWQTELLLLDLDQNRSRASAQESLTALAESAERLSHSAEALPADLESRATRLLTELETQQSELRTTLDSMRGTLEEGSATAHALTEAAQAIDAALSTFAALALQLAGSPRAPDAPPAPPGRPFDITEYTRTAEAMTASLTQLNGALQRVSELVAPQSSERLAALVDAGVDSALRRLAVWAAVLILLAGTTWAAARRWSAR
jgi:hypothetical protein